MENTSESAKENRFPISERIVYHSQFKEFPQLLDCVAKTACGLTSAAMAISTHRPDVRPLDVFLAASSLHHVPNSVTNFWLTTEIEGKQIAVPVGSTQLPIAPPGFNVSTTSPESSNLYEPVYSLTNGYDHRGSPRLFKKFDMDAFKIGDPNNHLSPEEIAKLANQGHVFMLSILKSAAPWLKERPITPGLSHIILLTDVSRESNQYHFFDPASPSGKPVHIIRPIDEFHATEFNGYGTAIHI